MTSKSRMTAFMLVLGLSASMCAAKAPAGLTQKDCWRVFPGSTAFEKPTALESGVLCAKVWEGEPADRICGYIFINSLQYQGSAIEVLVGVTTGGVISKITTRGGVAVEGEFLAQFTGKTLDHGFEIAKTPDDLLVLPAKIRAMKSNMPLSEGLTQSVQAVARAARSMVK